MKIQPLNSFRFLDVSNFRVGFLAWLKEARKQKAEDDQPDDPPPMDPVVAAMHNYGLYQSPAILSGLSLVNPTSRVSASELSRHYPYYASDTNHYGLTVDYKSEHITINSYSGQHVRSLLCEDLQDANEDWANYTNDTAVGYLLRRRAKLPTYYRIRTKLPVLAGIVNYYADIKPPESQPTETSRDKHDWFRPGEIIETLPRLNEEEMLPDEYGNAPLDYFAGLLDDDGNNTCYWFDDVIDKGTLTEMTRFDLCIPEYPDGKKPENPGGYDADADPAVSTLTVPEINDPSITHEVVKLTAGIPLVREFACMINSLRSYKKGEDDLSYPTVIKKKGIPRKELSRVPLRANWMNALIQSFDDVILKGNKLLTRRTGFSIFEVPLLLRKAKEDSEKTIELSPRKAIPTGTPYEFTNPEISIDPPNSLLDWPHDGGNASATSKGKLYAYPFALMVEWLTILRNSASVPIFPSSFIELGAPNDGKGIQESEVGSSRTRVVSTRTSRGSGDWKRGETTFNSGTMTIKYTMEQAPGSTYEDEIGKASRIVQASVRVSPIVKTVTYGFDEKDIPAGMDPNSFTPSPDYKISEEYEKYQGFTSGETITKGGPRVYRGAFAGEGYISFTQVFDNGTDAVTVVNGTSGTLHPWLKPELKIRVAYRDCLATYYRDGREPERKYKYRFRVLTLKPVKLTDATIMSGFKGDAVCLEAVDNGWISMMNSNSFSTPSSNDESIELQEISTEYIGPIDDIFELSLAE